jgi:hypothetical protein
MAYLTVPSQQGGLRTIEMTMKLETFTVMRVLIMVFWVVTLCSVVGQENRSSRFI